MRSIVLLSLVLLAGCSQPTSPQPPESENEFVNKLMSVAALPSSDDQVISAFPDYHEPSPNVFCDYDVVALEHVINSTATHLQIQTLYSTKLSSGPNHCPTNHPDYQASKTSTVSKQQFKETMRRRILKASSASEFTTRNSNAQNVRLIESVEVVHKKLRSQRITIEWQSKKSGNIYHQITYISLDYLWLGDYESLTINLANQKVNDFTDMLSYKLPSLGISYP